MPREPATTKYPRGFYGDASVEIPRPHIEPPTLLAEPAPPRFNPDLAAEGARLVEAAAGPGTRAAVAHWLEQDARRQQQAHRALRIVEALCRANATHWRGRRFSAEWANGEDARFVFDALAEMEN